jgi:hypothetical protein
MLVVVVAQLGAVLEFLVAQAVVEQAVLVHQIQMQAVLLELQIQVAVAAAVGNTTYLLAVLAGQESLLFVILIQMLPLHQQLDHQILPFLTGIEFTLGLVTVQLLSKVKDGSFCKTRRK